MHGRIVSSPFESMNADDIKNQVRTSDPFTSIRNCVENDRRRVLSYREKSHNLPGPEVNIVPVVLKEVETILNAVVARTPVSKRRFGQFQHYREGVLCAFTGHVFQNEATRCKARGWKLLLV